MRLVIAECTVDYDGRLMAHLPRAVRLIMVKADGCVAIHADGGAYKPLNWMTAPNVLTEDEDGWRVTNPKGETLTIMIHELQSDTAHDLGDDPGLQKDGVEAHLQELLAVDPERLGDGMHLIRREYPTEIGPVDLRDSDDHPFLGREMAQPRRFADETAAKVDEAVRGLLVAAEGEARDIIETHRPAVATLIAELERKETLDRDEIESCLGPRAAAKPGARAVA